MNKRGVEHQFFFAMEMILGIITVGIMISMATNFDALSNINKIYGEQDLKLLVETMQAAPGALHYDYKLKSLYDVNIQEDDITLTTNEELLAGYTYYNLSLEKEQNTEQIVVEKHG